MSRPVVFVDTNKIDNPGSAVYFLGGRSDLGKIAKRADIKLPRVVYEELHRHVCSFMQKQKDSFRKNPHRHLAGVTDEYIEKIDCVKYVDNLVRDETIPFKIVDLQDEAAAYKQAYRHALEGSAPFETNGDKGFKDTLIAKTIDQFAAANPSLQIFLLCKDGRLKEYFQETGVQVIDDFHDFDREYSEDKLEEDLLLDRIWDYFENEGVVLDHGRKPDEQWQNSVGDIVACFKDSENGDVHLLIDSSAREPVSFIGESPSEAIRGLESVGSYAVAHEKVAEVDYVFDYLGIEDLKAVARIMLANDQLYSISGDDDITQLASKLFSALELNSETDLAVEIRERYKIHRLTKGELANLPF